MLGFHYIALCIVAVAFALIVLHQVVFDLAGLGRNRIDQVACRVKAKGLGFTWALALDQASNWIILVAEFA